MSSQPSAPPLRAPDDSLSQPARYDAVDSGATKGDDSK